MRQAGEIEHQILAPYLQQLRHQTFQLRGRLARIVALAQQSLADRKSAARWLKRSNRALGGTAPIDAIDTELGARQVENVLGRIAFGGIS